jgi:hypothetical protein
MTQSNWYNPEIWLESTMRALHEYVGTGLNQAVIDPVSTNPVGLYDPDTNPSGPYEIIMEFPTEEAMRARVPLVRSIVSLELDAIENRPVGFGRGVTKSNYDPLAQTINEQEAGWHQLNFDIGIWSSDRSGGLTSRMRLLQILTNLFQGRLGQRALDKAVDNGDGRIEIIRFTGGRFITENVNDVVTYRSVDGELEVRVFSRTPLTAEAAPTIEQIDQAPDLSIVE